MTISVGFIGFGRHAKKLRSLIEEYPDVAVRKIFHPQKKINPHKESTRSFNDLLDLDAIFVAAPNFTHCDYLLRLSENGYSGYIFCEKPVAISKQELSRLSSTKIDKNKLFVNFNYRYSRFITIAERALKERLLGDAIAFYVNNTQGLAFKDDYPDSWRAGKKTHPLGVTETKTIHYLDMAVRLFGNPIRVTLSSRNIAETGTAVDTSKMDIFFEGGQWATFISSYAGPFSMNLRISGTNGELEYENDTISLYSPRSTFSRNGNFIRPPVVERFQYDSAGIGMGEESLRNSMKIFLDYCISRTPIPQVEYQNTIQVTKIMADLREVYDSNEPMQAERFTHVEIKY